MNSRDCNSKSIALVFAIAIVGVLLIGSTIVGHIVEAKKKTGKVTVSIKNWNCQAHNMKYRIQTEATEKTIGLKTFNFLYHEIECDQPTFTLDVKFSTKVLHNGEKLFACILDVDASDSSCGDTFVYKPGKKLHTTVDMHSTQLDQGNIRFD